MKRFARGATTWVALTLIAGCVPKSVSNLVHVKGLGGNSGPSSTTGSVLTGIKTDEDAPEEMDLGPYGYRVTWIAWDSPFRSTELRIGDRIVGDNDRHYRRADRKQLLQYAIGSWGESQYWEKRGAHAGKRVMLHVWRRGKLLDIQGKLADEHIYHTKDDKRALAPGGPADLVNDGFGSAWSSWYEKRVREWSIALDGGWRRNTFTTRTLLEAHREEKKRVDYLVAHYPGPMADATLRDWTHVRDLLLGPERRITKKDLEYRTLGDQRAMQIAAAAKAARKAFLAAHKNDVIDAFPTVDPIRGDLTQVVGKIVVLPQLGPRDWIVEAGHGYLIAGDAHRGYYFVDSRSPAMDQVLTAQYRYQEQVSPKIRDTYAIIGRVRQDPEMHALGSESVTGLGLEVIAVTVGDAMFVRTTQKAGDEVAFAGQKQLSTVGVPPVSAKATPRKVMQAAIAALKIGNKDAWKKLFARWKLSIYGTGRIHFDPTYYAGVPARDWVRARRLILGDVYDLNVVDVGLVHRLTKGDEFPGAPKIEEVDVEVEAVGKFPEGYRPFNDVRVNRVWKLQRVNGGPWRIVTWRGI